MAQNRIRDWRWSRGMTQEELAAAAGVSIRALRNAENGRSVPSLAVAQRVTLAVGAPAIELVFPQGNASRSLT